jgi:hypothetical protein
VFVSDLTTVYGDFEQSSRKKEELGTVRLSSVGNLAHYF